MRASVVHSFLRRRGAWQWNGCWQFSSRDISLFEKECTLWIGIYEIVFTYFFVFIFLKGLLYVCVCVCVYTARDKTHVMMTAATAVHVILVVVDVVCRRLHVARASQRYGHTPLHLQRAHLHVGRARRVCTLIRLQSRNNFGTIEFPWKQINYTHSQSKYQVFRSWPGGGLSLACHNIFTVLKNNFFFETWRELIFRLNNDMCVVVLMLLMTKSRETRTQTSSTYSLKFVKLR